MAWTTPMTAVGNEVWTASQFNTHVRDNLNETEAAKVTAAGQYLVSTGANALAQRSITSASETSSTGTTTSSTYTSTLTSGGTNPAVTVTTGTKAMVHVAARMQNSVDFGGVLCSYVVSGATTSASTDDRGINADGVPASNPNRHGAWSMMTLTAGSNTFTLQYRINGGTTGTFSQRHLIVVPL